MKNQYQALIGITKKDLIEKMGDECNFYQDTVWSYLLHKNFFGRKTFLIIRFENEIITHINIIKTYGNISAQL